MDFLGGQWIFRFTGPLGQWLPQSNVKACRPYSKFRFFLARFAEWNGDIKPRARAVLHSKVMDLKHFLEAFERDLSYCDLTGLCDRHVQTCRCRSKQLRRLKIAPGDKV